ncbi:DNA ligase [Fasciola gigantica]|uniref:DNA ligase n=1 Tax=Fasciola gigantica TaxID=46835 RepID=A0A504Z4B0_FASGI|nr:DNA ligase [Fasciola gigantica]
MEQFSKLCDILRSVSSHKEKADLINRFLFKENGGYKGDFTLLFRLILPKESELVYNLKDKQLLNVFSQIFDTDKEKMTEDLKTEEDAATTIGRFFEKSGTVKPASKSTLTLKEVNDYLHQLASLTKDLDRVRLLTTITKRCTARDLISFVRLIRQDLRLNAGNKQILDGLHPQAYSAYQASHDLEAVIRKVLGSSTTEPMQSPAKTKKQAIPSNMVSVGIYLMKPIKPMLAEACKSATQALSKAKPSGKLLAEIKYDGERVQVHKKGSEFTFYSRSLKPAADNKVSHVQPYIPQAFTQAKDLIIDCEILLLDTLTNKPLPFGSLGVHRRTAFQDATVCIFAFDCLYINGEGLIDKPISERRKVLENNFTQVPGRVLLSEKQIVEDVAGLNKLMARVFSENLEGLVLKPMHSKYEPGKRHWLKIKKDYLAEGVMADSVDLIVLGAYYGTGSKAGLMSVFLMGAYDPESRKFATVTKCGNGFTDELLTQLQKDLKMFKISKESVPSWLHVSKQLIPNFVVKDPKEAPVWEIIGAEFSRASTHTAGMTNSQTQGISIRFPRFTKARPDKTWKQATSVPELEQLVIKSGQASDWLDILNDASDVRSDDSPKKINDSSIKPGEKRPQPPGVKSVQSNIQSAKCAVPKKPRHLHSLFSGVVFELHRTLKKEDDKVKAALRQVVAGNGEFSFQVGPSFLSFVSPNPATHVLVPQGYQGKTNLPQVTLDQIDKSIKLGALVF